MTNMFCYQCEQAAAGVGCDTLGTCGKEPNVSALQDELTGALVALAKSKARNEQIDKALIDGLFTTAANVSFDERVIQQKIDYTKTLSNNAPSYDIAKIWVVGDDIKSLKSMLVFGVRGISAYAYHAQVLGCNIEPIGAFLHKALAAVGDDTLDMNELLALLMECGKVNFEAIELLDKANTEAFGTPTPTVVPLSIEPGPFIVISGHDLHDLKLLLEQTNGKGINIYTHGEMLNAHSYPKLKKYAHLKGNFGTAWQNQQKEFENIPAAVLFTTNCLMIPKNTYSDRVFTTAVAGSPEIVHIGENKDFTPVIKKALALGGYPVEQARTGINGGNQVTTGFGHGAVLGAADQVIGAVKTGAIKRFFLVGGCDGAKPGRNYYTDFVKQTPSDSIVLTLACGKYRFNDLDIGHIGAFPRIMDMGQCNDAYSAIKVAVALANAFDCTVNDLPLSLIISWYEQKAVSILLTLLHLNIKNIFLGPSLPAFVSPGVLKYLVDNFGISPISTPEQDLAKIIG